MHHLAIGVKVDNANEVTTGYDTSSDLPGFSTKDLAAQAQDQIAEVTDAASLQCHYSLPRCH